MTSIRTAFGDDATILRETDFRVLLLANVHPPLGIIIVSPLLDTLSGQYGIAEAEIGLLMTAYTAPAILATPIVGYLADIYGRKRILAGGLLLFGLAGTALTLTTEFRVALALRLLQGAGAACITPVIITCIGDLYAGAAETTAQGLRFSSSGLAQTVFPLLAGAVAVVAWYLPLALYALAIPTAVVVAVWFTETRPDVTARDGGHGRRRRLRAVLGEARRPPMAAMIVGRGVPPMLWFAFVTYLSFVVVRVLEGTPQQTGELLALTSVVYAVTATQVGRLTAVCSTRTVPLLGGTLAMSGGLLVVAVPGTYLQAALGVVLLGCGFGVILTLYRSAINDLSPAAHRGSLVSIAETIDRVAATTTPVAMGLLIGALAPTVGLVKSIQFAMALVSVLGIVVGTASTLVAYRIEPESLRVSS